MYDSLLYKQDSPKYLQYPAAANINIYFYLNYTHQIGLLKTGGMVCKLLI